MESTKPDSQVLWEICVNGVCHCDWRVNIHNCLESKAMLIIHKVNMALSCVSIVLGIALLYHRLFVKGHKLFEFNRSKGCFRPKPIDCMLLFITLYSILRLLSSAVLVTQIFPAMVSRTFLFDFPWQFGYGSFALYLIGVAQTLAESHSVIKDSWLPPPRIVDMIGGTLFFGPFVINNVLTLAAGIVAGRDLALALRFTRALYVFWFIHCSSLSLAVFLAGIRLARILHSHLEKFQTSGPRYVAIKTGIFKLKSVITIIISSSVMFALFLLLFGILREKILVNYLGSVILSAIWNLLGVFAVLFAEFAVIFSPKIDENASFGLKTTSEEKSNSQAAAGPYGTASYQSHKDFLTTTISRETRDMDSVSEAVLDDEELKLQRLQYQKVFLKHNQLPHIVPDLRYSKQTEVHQLSTTASNKLELDEETTYYTHGNERNHLTSHPEDYNKGSSRMNLVDYAYKL